jgi:hypothetical protein
MTQPPRETELNKAPALRISHIVYGRLNEHPEGRGRVSYLLDPEGRGEDRGIPEEVVLHRWRRRVMDGHTFHGCRLGPNLWRAVNHALGRNAEELISLGVDEIAKLRSSLVVDRDEHHFHLQHAGHVADLFQGLGKDRLQAILDRHLAPERALNFGTPDLFLFARNSTTKKLSFFRLVEVKKPGEHISRDQHDEIAFLRSLGVPARVLLLISTEK